MLRRVQDIAHGEEAPQKEEVDYLKTAFYKLHIAEREAKLKAYLDAGGDPEQYVITPDEDEEKFKAEMGIIKERRAKIFKEQEAEGEPGEKAGYHRQDQGDDYHPRGCQQELPGLQDPAAAVA